MKQLSKGFTLVELLVVIAILGVLMSVLVPAVTGYINKSNLNAMSINGSNIVKKIVAENLTGIDIWPHNDENDGLDSSNTGMINSQTYSTSTDYFKKLFDIDNQTSTTWAPLIDKEELTKLWGFGVPPAQAGNLQANNVAWTIASGVSESNSPGKLPVMVSRNLDTSTFAKSGNETMSSKKTERPSLTKKPQPFGEKGCVVVYKDGQGAFFESKNATLAEIYKDSPTITIPEGTTLKYLEP